MGNGPQIPVSERVIAVGGREMAVWVAGSLVRWPIWNRLCPEWGTNMSAEEYAILPVTGRSL